MSIETPFPHLTCTSAAPLQRDVRRVYQHIFKSRLAAGTVRPVVAPYHYYGIVLLFVYLCIPHTKSPLVYAARWPVLAAIVHFQWKELCETSSGSTDIAYYAGVASAWLMVLSATWLVWCRPQFEARRLNRRRRTAVVVVGGAEKGAAEGKASGNAVAGDKGLKQRRGVTGEWLVVDKPVSNMKKPAEANDSRDLKRQQDKFGDYEYYWQPYPDNLRERIPWVFDLLSNYRGVGWNWAITKVPDIPLPIKQQLGDPIDHNRPKGGSHRYFTTRRAHFKHHFPRFIVLYLLLDASKTIGAKDPYYAFGPNTYALPPYLQNLSPLTLYAYRWALSSFATVVSLNLLFSLGALVAVVLLGPRVLGPTFEPWCFPEAWGSLADIYDGGLAGFWGSWWHQSFRFAFSAPTNFLARKGYLDPRSTTTRVLALFVGFGLSGFVHAGGSLTQQSHTYPWHSALFFLVQPLGILLEQAFCSRFRSGIARLPRFVRRVGNAAYTTIWFLCTAPMLQNDSARGGMFLFEPLPLSPTKGLGFGLPDEGWWYLDSYLSRGEIPLWYQGKHWWQSGVRVDAFTTL